MDVKGQEHPLGREHGYHDIATHLRDLSVWEQFRAVHKGYKAELRKSRSYVVTGKSGRDGSLPKWVMAMGCNNVRTCVIKLSGLYDNH